MNHPHVRLGYDSVSERIAKLENEVDRLFGRPPRNRYTCTTCHDTKMIDESYHGSPEFVKCHGCDGGRPVTEANGKLLGVTP